MGEIANGSDRAYDAVFERELAAAFTNRSLHLIILPTEQCNFRCTYCYEDFKIGRMGPDVVQGVKRLLDRRLDSLERLTVSWFGGEPLLGRAVVEDVSRHIVEATAPDLRYAGDMTTNGYLLDVPTAERLAGLGVRHFQISLDGPESVHDSTRVRVSGRGSFRRIWQNLRSIRHSGLPVRVLLRIHLTRANLPTLPGFLAEVRETFLTDARFSVRLKPVERLGGPNDDILDVIPERDRARVLDELEGELVGGAPVPGASAGGEVCYAARANSFVIRANGDVGKCTVALSDPANRIGRLLPDGTLRVDNARLGGWVRGWLIQDWDAVGCPYVGMRRDGPQLLQIGSGPPTG